MNPNEANKKSKKIILIIFLVVFFLLLATFFVYSYYEKNIVSEVLKKELLENISNHDLAFFTKNELMDAINEKLEKEDYENSIDMTLSTTMENNMFSDLDLSKFEIIFNTVNKNHEQKAFYQFQTKYAGNDFITFDLIKNPKQFAIKSDEIVNKYVGINTHNVQNVVNKIKGTEVDLSDIRKLKNYVIDRENIEISKIQDSDELSNYINIVKDEIIAKNISKKENLVVTMDSEQINTTEYTIKFDSDQVKNMLQKMSEQIEKEDGLISELIVSKVDDFEDVDEVDNTILDYTDNDTTREVSAEENNFNTSLQIWSENTTSDTEEVVNTVPANTTTVEDTNTTTDTNTVITQVPQNTTVEEQTQESQVQQTESEQTTEEELVPQVVQSEEISPVQEIPQTENVEPNTTNVIEEDENLRTQGYFAINEDTEKNAEEDDSFIIGENYEETMKNINKWIEQINWKSYVLTGAKANMTEEQMIAEIQKIINKRSKQINSLNLKLYFSDEKKLIKVIFEIPETLEKLDIEIDSKGNNEKYLNLTYLIGETEDANGYEISLYKKVSDAVLKNKININKISKNKIKKKTSIDTQIKGTTNSKKYTANASVAYSDSDGEFKIDLDDVLNFDKEVQVDDLTDENCLFIDNLSDEDMLANVSAIKQKTIDVLREKNRNLNIIDLNSSNSIVQQTENEIPVAEDAEAKAQAKEVLIKTISDKMREYLNEGNNLKLEDLDGLEIPGYEVNISITSNLAIITVNGYNFKLDSDFNLSDS